MSPRIRYIKPDFFKDEDLANLPFEVRLFYIGLWNFADKSGRLEDRPLRLKVEIFPYDNVDIEKCLISLSKMKIHSNKPFIIRYEINKIKYIQILNWDEHQRPHHTEQDSKIPAPLLKEKGMDIGKGNGEGKGEGSKLEKSNVPTTVKEQCINVSINDITTYEELILFWEKNKKGGKYKNKESRNRMMNKLIELTHNNLLYAKEAIIHCIDNGYQGFTNGSKLYYDGLKHIGVSQKAINTMEGMKKWMKKDSAH